MKVKELIASLLNNDMSDDVIVVVDGIKRNVRCTISTESEGSNPRYYTEIMLE